jgi:hypothetical protein
LFYLGSISLFDYSFTQDSDILGLESCEYRLTLSSATLLGDEALGLSANS